MHTQYLIFDLAIFCLADLGLRLAVFAERKKNLFFHPQKPELSALLKAIAIMGTVFLVWDQLVSNWWWSFNPSYISGLFIGKLPIEEVLFFAIIPWSCLVIWVNLRTRFVKKISVPIEETLIGFSLVTGIWQFTLQHYYTASVGLLAILIAIYSLKQSHWLRQKNVLCFFAITITLTAIFNSYLTSLPIVIYNSHTITNLRIFTVPIEDFVYGWGLLSGTVLLYEKFVNRAQVKG